MKKFFVGIFIVLLTAPITSPIIGAVLYPDVFRILTYQSGREIGVPQRRRRHLRREVRRPHRGIRHAFKKAGTSAGRGGKLFGKHTARGRPVRGGKHLGKGIGGFGKHTGKGMARIGKRIAKP
jgi:hypothetical protein